MLELLKYSALSFLFQRGKSTQDSTTYLLARYPYPVYALLQPVVFSGQQGAPRGFPFVGATGVL